MPELNVKSLSLPEIAVFAATRGAIGMGAGLLLADKFKQSNRKNLGWSLLLSGVASTIPIAMYLRKKNAAAAMV
ncbi:MAG TPA: hypothetical protein VGD41_15810 [Pyrinomonadaceae bacterium]